jgi:hypothetical protein
MLPPTPLVLGRHWFKHIFSWPFISHNLFTLLLFLQLFYQISSWRELCSPSHVTNIFLLSRHFLHVFLLFKIEGKLWNIFLLSTCMHHHKQSFFSSNIMYKIYIESIFLTKIVFHYQLSKCVRVIGREQNMTIFNTFFNSRKNTK